MQESRSRRARLVVGLAIAATCYAAVTAGAAAVLLRFAAANLRHPYGTSGLVTRFVVIVAVTWSAYVALAFVLPALVGRAASLPPHEADRRVGRLLLLLALAFFGVAAWLTMAALRY